jgi:hypothetical protein
VLRILLERGARLTFVDQSGANILGELATSADLEGLKIIEDARMSGVQCFSCGRQTAHATGQVAGARSSKEAGGYDDLDSRGDGRLRVASEGYTRSTVARGC